MCHLLRTGIKSAFYRKTQHCSRIRRFSMLTDSDLGQWHFHDHREKYGLPISPSAMALAARVFS